MKYEEQSGPENFKRFERMTKEVLSVSNSVVRDRLAEEQRVKKRKKTAKKKH